MHEKVALTVLTVYVPIQPKLYSPFLKILSRTMASQNWQSERKRLEGLSQEERRKNYYCGDKFIPLSEVPTWKEYFLQNEKSLTEKGILHIT